MSASADAAGARRGVDVMAPRRTRGTGNAPGDAGAAVSTTTAAAAAPLGRACLLGEADHDAQNEGGGQFAGMLGGEDSPGKRVRLGRQRYVMQWRRWVGMRQQHNVVGGIALLAPVSFHGFHV